jgi:hypothetical protein
LPQRLPRPPRNICGPSMPPRQPFSWAVDGSTFLRFRARAARGALPLTCRALSQSLLDDFALLTLPLLHPRVQKQATNDVQASR